MKTFKIRGKKYRWNIQKMDDRAFWALLIAGAAATVAIAWMSVVGIIAIAETAGAPLN